jgi:hypothetical protein
LIGPLLASCHILCYGKVTRALPFSGGIPCADIAEWSEYVNGVCPSAAAGESVPSSCPELCGTVFDPWCSNLSSHASLIHTKCTANLDTKPFSWFTVRRCRWGKCQNTAEANQVDRGGRFSAFYDKCLCEGVIGGGGGTCQQRGSADRGVKAVFDPLWHLLKS